MKKTGLFGGSFDPLHFGHLNMAITLLEVHGLDRVYFCPSGISPFKTEKPPIAAAEHRLAMVNYGIQKMSKFSVLDWEIKRPGPSYTIETIQKLNTEEKTEIFLLLGEDQISQLHEWKNVEHLFTLCKPLIAAREGNAASPSHLSFPLQSLIVQGRTKIPMMDISSTRIRKRLSEKKPCYHLIPDLILDYIERHRLYS